MKIKSPASKWAIALCAFAVFSFTAQAAIRPDGIPPGPTVLPPIKIRPPVEPFPAIQPPVEIGTFNGTVKD